MATTRLSFSYPEDLKTQVKEIAEKESRSVSSMIQVFIKEGLQSRTSKRPATKRKTKRTGVVNE